MRLIISAGGTGGHIMPALAIADAIRKERPDTKLLFIGTDRGLEEKLAHKYGIPFIPVKSSGIKGKSLRNLPGSILINALAFFTALKTVSAFRPDWVVGTGGYVTGMVVLAGRLTGARCAIQEQNSVPGLTNRLLAKIVQHIFLSFPDKAALFPARKSRLTGNPLRAEFSPPLSGDRKRLLIMGGSLGATSINQTAVKALGLIKGSLDGLEIIHQTGHADADMAKAVYDAAGIKVYVEPFIEDIAGIFSQARLAVCRAGGITLSELSKMGVPAIMIPLPHAADNHQYFNALSVAEAGGGWVLEQSEMTPERLAEEIRKRLSDRQALSDASKAMLKMGLGEGTERITMEILKCSGE